MPIDAVGAEKSRLRQEMLSRRRAISPEVRTRVGEQICTRIAELPVVQAADIVMLYASTADELDIFPLMERLLSLGKCIALPEIVGKGVMTARGLPAMDALVEGRFGILTPDPMRGAVIALDALDVIIVPGAAFSTEGARLGLGGGYYDRFLPLAENALRIAAAYEWQIIPQIPMDVHDAYIDMILTEQRTVICREIMNNPKVEV